MKRFRPCIMSLCNTSYDLDNFFSSLKEMNSTNVTSNDFSAFTLNASWSQYLILAFNIISILISLGKQFVNSKKHIDLSGALDEIKSFFTQDSSGKVVINVPNELKSSNIALPVASSTTTSKKN